MEKPISPQEALASAKPDFVVKAVNSVISTNFTGNQFTVTQDEIIEAMIQYEPSLSRQKIFDNGYLNFESIYDKYGWTVIYDKPGYCENYTVNFTFKPKQ